MYNAQWVQSLFEVSFHIPYAHHYKLRLIWFFTPFYTEANIVERLILHAGWLIFHYSFFPCRNKNKWNSVYLIHHKHTYYIVKIQKYLVKLKWCKNSNKTLAPLCSRHTDCIIRYLRIWNHLKLDSPTISYFARSESQELTLTYHLT